MSNKCKCTMAQSLAGDGCDECNPKLALEYAKETIRNLEEDAEAQVETINELMQALLDIKNGKDNPCSIVDRALKLQDELSDKIGRLKE